MNFRRDGMWDRNFVVNHITHFKNETQKNILKKIGLKKLDLKIELKN